jgi:hypothetical protein
VSRLNPIQHFCDECRASCAIGGLFNDYARSFWFPYGHVVRSAVYGFSLGSSHHAYVDAYDQYRCDAGFRVLVGCSRHIRFEHSSSIWIRRRRCPSDPPQRSGVDFRAGPRRTVATQEAIWPNPAISFSRPSECLVSLSIQNVPKDDPALKRPFRLFSIIRAPSIKTCSGSPLKITAPLPEMPHKVAVVVSPRGRL